jgi:tRNA isopentenyl-2-thiomethyl-A-37 hydroxylase MiaE
MPELIRKMKKEYAINWEKIPEEQDYPAAASYLSLIFNPDKVEEIVKKLRETIVVNFKAKDIFRASQLSLLGISNSHVEKDRKKIMKNKKLSPILLVRDTINGKLIIADGYHRLCAIYTFNEDELIFCKIVSID